MLLRVCIYGCWRLSSINWTAFLLVICSSMLNAQRTNTVRPFPPTDLTLNHSSERKILASWGFSEGWQDDHELLDYQLRYRVIAPLSAWHKVPDDGLKLISGELENLQYYLVNLNAYTTYEVQVRAKYHVADAPGMWSTSVNITTQEEYPVGQLHLSYEETESDDDKETYRNIILTWEVPEMMKARGKILGFEIQLLENGVHFNVSRLNDGSITQHTFKNLLRDANYTVIISAYNSVSSSTHSILNIVPSPADIGTVPSVVIAVIVSFAIIVILLVLAFVWKQIKEVEICLPIPEPNFNILKWKHIPNARAYVEDEVFDELRQRRAVPTKDELDTLMKKLPDPALKDVILELLISKYSIDYEWQRIQHRKSRLLSNNTEISFLSDDDDDGDDLISNLGSMPGCKNTVLSYFQRECSGGLARYHSLPILDEKYTKHDVNMKEVAYTSSSGDTSGIGSESSDQDLESECQMVLCRNVGPAATLDKPNTISPYTEYVGIPKVSQKSHVNVPSLHEKHGYISARDVAKVVQSPTNDPRNRSQRTTQSNVSEYLDAAQMRQLQNHQQKQKQLWHMQKKPKASDNGYVDVKDMHKFVDHLPKFPAENMPKPSVYVQHEELPALLAYINPSSSNNSPHPGVETSPKSQMCPKVNHRKWHHVVTKNQDVISKVSPYVKGASIISAIRPSPKSHPKTSDHEKQKVDVSDLKELVTLAAPTCRYPINTNISNEPKPTSTKSLACTLPSNKPSTDYITLKYTHGHSPSQATHWNKTNKVQKLSPFVNGSLSQRIVQDRQKIASHSAQRLPPSNTSDLQNSSALAKQIPPSGTSGLQNINGSGLARQNSPSVTLGSGNINGSVLPRQSPPYGTSGSRNINGSVLPRQKPPSGTSGLQHISGSAIPRPNVQQNNSKVNQDGGYIPILSLAHASSTASSSVKQHAQLPIHQTTVPTRSPFQNQGRMMKGRFKSAKFIYKVSPSL